MSSPGINTENSCYQDWNHHSTLCHRGMWRDFALAIDKTALGPLLETFVFQELRRQASWHEGDIRFYHFRDRDNFEVDIVLESGAHGLAGIEVKASATVNPADFLGLRKLKDAAKGRFIAGVVLYDGEAGVSFGNNMFAVPLRMLWETA